MICKLCVSESELANPWRSYTYIGVWMLELCFGIFWFGGISSRQMRILISNVRGARFESAQAWNSVSNCLINVGFVGLHLGPLVFGYLLRWGWNFIVGQKELAGSWLALEKERVVGEFAFIQIEMHMHRCNSDLSSM